MVALFYVAMAAGIFGVIMAFMRLTEFDIELKERENERIRRQSERISRRRRL